MPAGQALAASSCQIPRKDRWVLMAIHSATWTQLRFFNVTCRMTPPNVSPLSACLILHPV